MENKMKYNVNWLISGTIDTNATSKEDAEKKIRLQLEEIINQNKIKFEKVGATAIQGSAKAIK